MAKISNDEIYIVDADVSDLDSLIGTDGNSLAKKTKNFLLGQLKSYFISGLRINRQHDCAYLERDVATQVYTLLGNTKV